MLTLAIETTDARLEALAARHPALSDAVAFYRRLLPVLREARADVTLISMDGEAMRRALALGTPVLTGEGVARHSPDAGAGNERIFTAICRAIEQGIDGAGGASAGEIRAAASAGTLDLGEVLSAAAYGYTGQLESIARRLGLDDWMLEVAAQNTLKVIFGSWREGLESKVDLAGWEQGRCPFCGAWAGLAERQGVTSARHLRCLRCGADWPYLNLKCAYCGNVDAKTLSVLLLGSEVNKPHIHACETCHGYLKTITTFEPTPPELLVVIDLETLHLDRLAVERGYKRQG